MLLLPPVGMLLYGMFYRQKLTMNEIRHINLVNEVTDKIVKEDSTLYSLSETDRLAYGKALFIIKDEKLPRFLNRQNRNILDLVKKSSSE